MASGRPIRLMLLAGALALSALGPIALAPPARAAFPGRNGLLAVQPLRGGGIVLVGAQGQHPRRICTNVATCGTPRDPRFSPSGREILFSGPAVRLVATDGSCVNCQFGSAGSPAFLPGGTLVTFVSGADLLEDGIDGLWRATLHQGASYSDAVWSSRGELAVVRAGRVWIGRPKRLHPFGAGSSPAWSPDGSRLAIAHAGWIVIVDPSSHRSRRLIRGSAPAFSPDGRWIAFIGSGHTVRVVSTSGGRARSVGRVRGTSVDWQPIPSGQAPVCVAPPGSTVAASSAQAEVTTASVPNPQQGWLPNIAAMGCVKAMGLERLLEKFTFNSLDDANQFDLAAIAGNYAALVVANIDEHYGGETDGNRVFDLQTAAPGGFGGQTASCAGDCVRQLVLGGDGVSVVRTDTAVPPGGDSLPITATFCVSDSLCLASDQFGDLTWATDPGHGPWSSAPVATLEGLSCPSSSLCVGTSGPSGIFTSTDPTGGQGAWTEALLPGTLRLQQVSCPSSTLCVAAAGSGDIVLSTNPTGGAAAWSIENVDGLNQLYGISCPSSSECIATDSAGSVISSTDPTGGPGAWAVHQIGPPNPVLTTVSCATTSLCVAAAPYGPGPGGSVSVSIQPTTAQWTLTHLSSDPYAVDCPSVSLCVAVGQGDTVDTSTDPASGSWATTALGNSDENLTSVSCPADDFCIATGSYAGIASVSTDPTGGPTAWSQVLADPIDCAPNQPCSTEQIIASDATGVHTVDQSREFEPQTGEQLTDLALTGDQLTWEHGGTPMSAQLRP